MDSGRKTNRTGLLMMKKHGAFCVTLTVFMLIFSTAVFAQETDNEDEDVGEKIIRVYVETSPQTPTSGVPWLFTIIVDHGVPEEITVIAPPLPPLLSLDRIIKTPRMTNSGIQTSVQYRFIANTSGRYTLDSFTIVTPFGITETDPYVLEIRGPVAEQRTLSPRLVWEGSPGQMTAGERAALSLRVTDWNSRLPPQEFFMPEVPRGAILEILPLTDEERSRSIAIKLNLIPLEGDFRLPARTLRNENIVFAIPALNIRVTRTDSRVTEREPPVQNTAPTQDNGEISNNIHAPFPDFNLASPNNLFFNKIILDKVWYAQCENIYSTVRDLWDSGFYVQALAELRQNERDHPAGALLRQIRREAEEKLMFFNTENENRWQRKLLLGLFFLVIIVLFICFPFIRKSLRKRAALLCAVVFAAVGLVYAYVFLDSRSFFGGNKSRFGVTNETSVRRTADFNGEKLFSFSEGRPVMIMLNSGTWVFVRANDQTGGSGWIPAEDVIFY